MGFGPLFLTFLAIVAGIVLIVNHFNRARNAAWKATAEAFDLRFMLPNFLEPPKLRGQWPEGDVVVELVKKGTGNNRQLYTQITMDARGGIPLDLGLKAEGVMTKLGKKVLGDDVLTHDRGFDEAIFIKGNPMMIVALMNVEARRTIRRVMTREPIKVRKGRVCFTMSGTLRDAERLQRLIADMRSVLRCTKISPTGFAASLRANALNDPLPQVRRINLELLLRRFPETLPEVQGVCEAMIEDEDPGVRLLAAKHLGDDAVLESLARDLRCPDETRAGALDAVVFRLPRSRSSALIEEVLKGRDALLLTAAARAVEKLELKQISPRLLALLADGVARPPAVIAAFARALEALGEKDAESLLIGLLLTRDEPEILVAAAHALARVGGADALEPLLPLTKGLRSPAEVKKAARGAVEAIQSKLAVSAGHLSLIEPVARGGLSIVEPDHDTRKSGKS